MGLSHKDCLDINGHEYKLRTVNIIVHFSSDTFSYPDAGTEMMLD